MKSTDETFDKEIRPLLEQIADVAKASRMSVALIVETTENKIQIVDHFEPCASLPMCLLGVAVRSTKMVAEKQFSVGNDGSLDFSGGVR